MKLIRKRQKEFAFGFTSLGKAFKGIGSHFGKDATKVGWKEITKDAVKGTAGLAATGAGVVGAGAVGVGLLGANTITGKIDD